jgi:hypothetical protein
MDNDITKCVHLVEFMRAESEVIYKHLEAHKWYQHLEKDVDALIDFNEKYGWLMREMYCRYACPDRDKCLLAKDLKQ